MHSSSSPATHAASATASSVVASCSSRTPATGESPPTGDSARPGGSVTVALTPTAIDGRFKPSFEWNGATAGSSAVLMASTSSAGNDAIRTANGPDTLLCTFQ